jgi:LmbE family N-acetylglucosaminyl deacetylase
MRKLLALFAHPDDEGAISGTLAHYAQQGVHISLICATSGEAGEISDPSLATPDNLGAVREAELRCACEIIGINELHLLGYCDSGMDGTAENNKATAFIQADPGEVVGRLVQLIRRIKPHIVITFEPFGWYGHPDHKAVSLYTTEAMGVVGNPQAHPLAGPAWQPARLFHSVLPVSNFRPVMDYAREHGLESFGLDDEELWRLEAENLEGSVTHVLEVEPLYDVKRKATACHRTQFGEDHLFNKLPPGLSRQFNSEEHFIQVYPQVEPGSTHARDLFAGLPKEATRAGTTG